jgi:hypothetical protein
MSNLSLAQLTSAHNSIPGVKPVKRFPSKDKALAAVAKAGYSVNAEGVAVPGDAPFEKATKEALAAMSSTARAAYRKARRAAARAVRKARRAAA